LAAAGIALYQRASRNLAQIQMEIANTVNAEVWSQRHNANDMSGMWIDPEAPQLWKSSVYATSDSAGAGSVAPAAFIQDVDLDSGLAMVRVRIDVPGTHGRNGAYLETRFYRLTETGWLRTAPQEEFWGKENSAETAYFTFTYRQRDAAAVREVISNLDEQYVAMRAEFGLETAPTDERLRIVVLPMILPLTDPALYHFQGDRLTLPSPLQLPAPEGLAGADILRASILEPLADHIPRQILSQNQVQCQWRALGRGVRLWARQQYRVVPSARQVEMESILHSWSDLGAIRLLSVAEGSPDCYGFRYHESLDTVADMVAKNVVSFAVLTYGSESLPSLLESMAQYDNWQELIPAAFGVPADEFETGWRAYFVNEYQ
jgi:hypothetical protein